MPGRIWKKQLWAVFLLILAPAPWGITLAASHIDRFVFVTEPQSVKTGEISKELSIQAQDAAGNPVEAGETLDLEFTSSSASGEFLNPSGNPASTVMNKDWKSRNFYYRDSAAGGHDLKVKITGREPDGKSWEATQSINVSPGQSAPPPLSPTESTPASSPEASSVPKSSAAPAPTEAPSPAEPSSAPETSLPSASVREEEPAPIVAARTSPAMPLITSVQVPIPIPAPEAPKQASEPQRRAKPESLPVALAAAPPSNAAVVGSGPRASSSPGFFLILASALSGTAAAGFLVIKKFFWHPEANG